MEHKLLEFIDLVISHGFKSIVACVLVGEVGLNSILCQKMQAKRRCVHFECVSFWVKEDVQLPARLPFQRNVRHTTSTRISNTRKRETHVLGARLTLGFPALKFQGRTLS
jgi:hypothetical protein